MVRLPTLEQIKDSVKVENKFTDHQKVTNKLEPLIKFIAFDKLRLKY